MGKERPTPWEWAFCIWVGEDLIVFLGVSSQNG